MLKRTLFSFIFLSLLGCHHDEKNNAASQPPPQTTPNTLSRHCLLLDIAAPARYALNIP